ncbi:MAG: hypothetical protein AAFX50_16430 [Acidobacteriota bacterium]
MTKTDPEELLWRLPSAGAGADTDADADALFRAYRSGELTAEEAAAVEARLARDAAARRRLVRGAEPPEALKARVFESLARAAAAADGARPAAAAAPAPRRRRRPSRRLLRGVAFAAALAVAAGLALVLALWDRPQPPPLPAFEVTVAGLVDTRGDAPARARAAAYPSTLLTVDVVASSNEPPGEVSYRLYRRTPAGFAAVPSSAYRVERSDGAARLEGTAGEIVAGGAPGRHVLVLVVARPGGEPGPDQVGGGGPRSWRELELAVDLREPD